MKERPILFSGPMVRAILESRKTQTRRTIKPRDVEILRWFSDEDNESRPGLSFCADGHSGAGWYAFSENYPDEGSHFLACHYGQPGDRLWVREKWRSVGRAIEFAADHTFMPEARAEPFSYDQRWRPSIYMPRWASRITLELTDVRAERLQDISEGDARAEGCPDGHHLARDEYAELWDEINGNGEWLGNPWVWVLGFKRIDAKSEAA